ncbi:hypothetical protein [Swingsia samuiensis]|uniref:Lipoprotein n=1 Tax=Swingsia samuiensis TaxID=1293412 RepID=A0A4Y6UJF6_9PROT|nr:hypothetical protein [Swingsia samuiensis]QDH16497.1 hypothetical protein E3D00_02090 [Swingsia samuiensis]
MSLNLARTLKSCVIGLSLLGLSACVGTASPGPVDPKAPVAGYGNVCKAGIYSCKLPVKAPLNGPCSCPGLGAASYGNVFAK